MPEENQELNCSFCGKSKSEVDRLIAGPGVYICNEIVIVFASKDEKVGIAVGVTEKLTEKYDAVNFVKVGSEIIGGKGGGGRKDFAQAGGQDEAKIDQAFESIKKLI